MSVFRNRVIGHLEDHIRELDRVGKIPDEWLWWNNKEKKFQQLNTIDMEIVKDLKDFYHSSRGAMVKVSALKLYRILTVVRNQMKDFVYPDLQKREAEAINSLIQELETLLKQELKRAFEERKKVKQRIIWNFKSLSEDPEIIGLRGVTTAVINELLVTLRLYPNPDPSSHEYSNNLYFWTHFDHILKYKIPGFTTIRGAPRDHKNFLLNRTVDWAHNVEGKEYFYQMTGLQYGYYETLITQDRQRLMELIKDRGLSLDDLKKIKQIAQEKRGFVIGLKVSAIKKYNVKPDKHFMGRANYAMQIYAPKGIEIDYLTITPLGQKETEFLKNNS